jgi:hypothetical protein
LGASAGGPILAHQGRVVQLLNSATQYNNNYSVRTNDIIAYTNTNTTAFNSTLVSYGPEDVGGYGAWGSISAGELILIKQYGGALYVTGDLSSPNITRLPGVASTRGFRMKGVQCSAGLVYYSADGIYTWDGGNSSRLLSRNITDPQGTNGTGTINLRPGQTLVTGYPGSLTHQWDLADNSFIYMGNSLYDIRTGGFWRLYSGNETVFNSGPGGQTPSIWAASRSYAGLMYGLSANTAGQGDGKIYLFSTGGPNNVIPEYSWTSMPIYPAPGRAVVVDEVEIIYTNGGPSYSTIAVTLSSQDESGVFSTLPTYTYTTPYSQGGVRINGGLQCYQFLIKLVCKNNADPLQRQPIIERINIWWHESNLSRSV